MTGPCGHGCCGEGACCLDGGRHAPPAEPVQPREAASPVGWGDDAYAGLADRLGMPRSSVHIGAFDVATCERVVRIAAEMSTP